MVISVVNLYVAAYGMIHNPNLMNPSIKKLDSYTADQAIVIVFGTQFVKNNLKLLIIVDIKFLENSGSKRTVIHVRNFSVTVDYWIFFLLYMHNLLDFDYKKKKKTTLIMRSF